MSRPDPRKGFHYSLIGTFLVSTNFVTAKYGLLGFNPETFSLVWTSAAACYAFIVTMLSKNPPKFRFSLTTGRRVVVLGVVTGVGMLLAWAGLAQLDPSFASFIWRFSPVMVIILGAGFLKERFTFIETIPLIIMIAGGIISTLGRWHIVGIGIILTVSACLSAAIQMLMAKMVVTELHPNHVVFYRVGIGAVVIALWTFVTGKADFNVDISYWLVTFLGAFLGPTASFLFTFRAYRYWELSRSSMIRTAQPLFVLPLAYIFFNKLPVPKELIGGFLIMIGAFWLAWIHLGRMKDVSE